MTYEQILDAYRQMSSKTKKLKFGLHTMIGSNELNEDNLIWTANMMFDLYDDISNKYQPPDFINIGAGLEYHINLTKKNLI